MYTGVRNHHTLPEVACYEDARKALAIWESKPRRGKQVTKVVSYADSIAFRLYDTDVVEWHPDDSFDVNNYGTLTTSGFARHFLPGRVWLNFAVERRNGCSGGANTISFAGDGKQLICQGEVVRFRKAAVGYLPDEATCYDITLPSGVDRKAGRELAKEHHLREFESWLTVAPITLGDVEHAEWNLAECLYALKSRDWRQAAMHLPLIKEPSGFGTAERMKPLPIATGSWQHHITMASFGKLKLAMWEDAGLLETETRRVWDRKTFDTRMAKVKEMENLGLPVASLGPR